MSKRNMNTQKKKVGNRKAGTRNSIVLRKVASHPPTYISQAIRSLKIRCLATGAVNSNFTFSQMSSILGIVATAATTSVFWTAVYRLTRIVIWSPVTTAGSPVTCVLKWQNSGQDFESPPEAHSDTSISFDWPAFIDSKPPQGSLSDKWHGSSATDEHFSLVCPVGSTVEFDFQFVLNDADGPIAGPTIVGGTLGQMYHKIVGNLTPQAVNSI